MKKLLLISLLFMSGGALIYAMGEREKPAQVPKSRLVPATEAQKSLLILAQDRVIHNIEEKINSGELTPATILTYFQARNADNPDFYVPIIYRLILISDQLTIAQKAEVAQAIIPELRRLIQKPQGETGNADIDALEFLVQALSSKDKEEKFFIDQTYKGTLVDKTFNFPPIGKAAEEEEEEPEKKVQNTLLGEAAEEGLIALVKALVATGADVTIPSSDGHTPLHDAAFGRNFKMVRYIIGLLKERGALEANINRKSDEGHTPLYETILKPSIYMEEFKIEPTDENQRKLLQNQTEVMEFLKNNGADLHSVNADENTLLMQAAMEGDINAAQFFIKNGVNPDEQRTTDGIKSIHLAASNGEKDMLAFLVQQGADIKATDNDGSTVLHWAVEFSHHHVEIVAWLVRQGINVNVQNNDNKTPLHWAVSNSNEEGVQALLSQGANVNARDNRGETPLFYTIGDIPEDKEEENKAIIKLLLEHDADVTITDNNGETALDIARTIENIDPEIINLLSQGQEAEIEEDEQEEMGQEMGEG